MSDAPLGTSLPETAPLDREALVSMLLGYRSECMVSDRWNALAYERADWILAALALPPLEVTRPDCPTNHCDASGDSWSELTIWDRKLVHCPDCGEKL